MSEKPVPFNMNQYVRVKLTDIGREILQARRDELNAIILSTKAQHFDGPLVVEDADGWSRWQLWDLMSTFGSRIHMGGRIPFQTDLEFLVEKP